MNGLSEVLAAMGIFGAICFILGWFLGEQDKAGRVKVMELDRDYWRTISVQWFHRIEDRIANKVLETYELVTDQKGFHVYDAAEYQEILQELGKKELEEQLLWDQLATKNSGGDSEESI